MEKRELLEAAARAAGFEFKESAFSAGAYVIRTHEHEWSAWNPLEDDGAALRLAVRLGLHIGRDMGRATVSATGPGIGFWSRPIEPLEPDPYAATRLAIVRAAAAIDAQRRET